MAATVTYDSDHDVITIDTHKNSWFDRVFGVEEAFQERLQRQDQEKKRAAQHLAQQQEEAARAMQQIRPKMDNSQKIQQAMMAGMSVMQNMDREATPVEMGA